ncbi:hypothetical protein [Paenibacillus roseipurpureus]|uniref:Uncharacterized protein n=1 Tax=Paenibacillus roseopurpureus TaxID=2918901 RepID=A0AA96LME7_9BACL|nr:hypothetical protein [Paenibacillus sp. MBLB1832]WNR43664.1 hypothetical protein MJB10_21565 [Paenibacillus sp. MBLB1832]
MKHIAWFGFNLGLIVIGFIITVFAFSYFITAEEYTTHSASFVDVQVNPTKDAMMFTLLNILSAILYVSLSKFQIGTYLSKALISLVIIVLHAIIMLYGLVLYEAEFPLTEMRLVTEIIGAIGVIMSGLDLLKNTKRVRTYFIRIND